MSTINGVAGASLPSALASGQSGLAASSLALDQEAQQIANPGSVAAEAALLDSSQALLLAEGAAAIIKTANQMLGTLLNAHA